MAAQYKIPPFNQVMRKIMRSFFRFIFHLFSRVEISGHENIPDEGAYLIAYNHVSLYEPPLLFAYWPTVLEGVAAADIWSRPGQSLLVKLYQAIPVHRNKFDRQVFETMISALEDGRPLAISPEGGRSHQLGLKRAFTGIAYILEHVNVPVIPVGIIGTSDDFIRIVLSGNRPRLELKVGKPFYLETVHKKGQLRKTIRQKNADIIMTNIASLLPPEYWGVYA